MTGLLTAPQMKVYRHGQRVDSTNWFANPAKKYRLIYRNKPDGLDWCSNAYTWEELLEMVRWCVRNSKVPVRATLDSEGNA